MDKSSCIEQPTENNIEKDFTEARNSDESEYKVTLNEEPLDIPKKSELAVKLDETGLKSCLWLPVFLDKLGIDCVQQLQYLKESDIKKLIKHTDLDWEKEALKCLMKDKPDYSKRLSEVMSEAKEVCKRFSTKKEHAKTSLEQLRLLLSVPEDQWQSQMKKLDLTQIVQSLEFQFSKVETCISRSNKEDMEVIKCASGGRVLTGVFVTEDTNDLITPRSSVINITTDIELKSMFEQINESFDFYSHEMSQNFHRGIDVYGVSLSAYAKKSFLHFGGILERKHETYQTAVQNKKHSFYSRVKYSSISLASCELRLEHVYFLPDVEKELHSIETLSRLCCREEYLIYECSKFYQKYGSHINLGRLHFGGIYQWIASHSSENVCEIQKTKDVVKTCLSSYITAYIPIQDIGSEVTAKYLKTKGGIEKAYSEEDLSHTTLKVIRIGGPIEIDEFYLWKYELTSCNSTWSLINRGDLVGIWEVVEYYSSKFNNSFDLSKILKVSLGAKQKRADFTDDKQLTYELTSLIKDIKDYNSTYFLISSKYAECIQLLEKIIVCKGMKIKIDGTDSKWIDLLTKEKTFQEFFSKVMTLSKCSNTVETANLKYLLRQILHPNTDTRFSKWIEISKWISLQTVHSHVSEIEIDVVNSIQKLLSDLRNTVLPLTTSTQDRSHVEEMITCQTAILCNHCYSSMQRSDESYSIVILNIGLIKLYYDEKQGFFLVYLTSEKLKIFIEELEKHIQQSEHYKQSSLSKMQAYLTLNIITSLKEQGFTDKSEYEFDKCLSPVRNKLDDMILSAILKNQNEGYYKWDLLGHDLMCLQNGENICRPLCCISGINLDPEENITDDALSSESTEHTMQFVTLLENLGLKQYNPNKLKLSDVLKVTIVNNECGIKDIPWLFLRNIVMSNSHSRDKLIKTELANVSGSTPTTSDDWNYDDDDAEIKSPILDVNLYPNPQDLLAIIYMCSEPILQQTISLNLFSCRLAVPFVLPKTTDNETKLKILLWPLRAINLKYGHQSSILMDTAADCPCHVVSFMRFDKTTVSKSKLMNQILSAQGDEIFDTFFNADCPFGSNARQISVGMIEAAWHIPRIHMDISDTITLYLNLRGNGTNDTTTIQQKFLSDISSVLVITLNIEHLSCQNSRNILISIHKSAQAIVLAIDGMSKTEGEIKEIIQDYQKFIGEFKKKLRIIKLASTRNFSSLSDVGTNALKEISWFTKSMTSKSLVDRLKSSKQIEVEIDEQLSFFHQTASKLSSGMMQNFPRDITAFKTAIVPLQGKPWHTVSANMKIQQQSTRYTSQKEKQKQKQEISEKRSEQLLLLNKQHIFMKQFVTNLNKVSHSEALCSLFVTKLKQELDKISWTVLPGFQDQLHQAFEKLNQQTNEAMKKFDRSEVRKYEKLIFDASFGFEHLVREMGQMFEALTEPGLQSDIDDESKLIGNILPKLCARLLLMGQPFELMDGDTANVPLRWIKAVLDEVTTTVGNRNILTLSVIGIQSSGKSTLLNTLFGLQFPVSAGRCTRGIFMQLIKTDSAKFEFDYVLVLDTEGLRTPALSDCNVDNDNKLATFVIGLGDIALINVQGASLIEIRNVLEIVIQAFLRLRQAQRKKLKLSQNCIFVHHNVSSPNAAHELFTSRQADVNYLDEITHLVATDEDITDVNYFNQILQFDKEKDIWYFTDLWLGSPPMAPRNPAYSSSCVALKSSILEKNVCHNTIVDFTSLIDDLWQGILSDNFVFSFRNSLEVKTYNIIEKKYQELALKLERYEFDFLHSETRSVLAECTNEKSIESISSNVITKFTEGLGEKVQKLKEELNQFVIKHTLKDKMEFWKQRKIIMLGQDEAEHIRKFHLDFYKLKEETRLEIIHSKEKINYEQEINKLATDLARSIDKEYSTEMLEDLFNTKWTTWMTKFSSRIPPNTETCTVYDEINRHVVHRFSRLGPCINESIDNLSSGVDIRNMNQLAGSITIDSIENNHISIKTRFYHLKDNNKASKLKLVHLTNSMLKKIDRQLKKTVAQDMCFNIAMVSEIFHIVDQEWTDWDNDENIKLCIQLSYKGMVIAHLMRYLTTFFIDLNDAYNVKHSSKSRLCEYKDTAMIYFKGLVKTKKQQVIVADICLDTLKKIIIEHVSGCIPIDVYEKLLAEFPSGKESIIRRILSYLLQKACPRTYFRYIKFPNPFVKEWLQTLIHKKILSPKEDGGISEYCQLAKDHVRPIIQVIQENVSSVTKNAHCDTAQHWLASFVENINASKLLPLSRHQFVHVENICEFDIQEFSANIINQLDDLEENIVNDFKNSESIKWKENPVDRLFDKLWGCQELCPFCVEPCKQTNKDHVNDGIPHSCLQHRIQGVAGHSEDQLVLLKFKTVSTLTLETCNDKIEQPDVTFKHGKEYIMWKNYKEAFKDWEIEKNNCGNSYWKWFVCHYEYYIEKEYGITIPKRPDSWKLITKEMALNSLVYLNECVNEHMAFLMNT